MYIHDLAEWPNFTWHDGKLKPLLEEIRELQTALNTELNQLGFEDKTEASLRVLTQDVVKTSEIEGEQLDPALVRSSIARRLGLDVGGLPKVDRQVEGIVHVVLDATTNFDKALTQDRLFGWHASLFPTGYGGYGLKILVGQWRDDRDGPMQVVSGVVGKERVHFVAPDRLRLPSEMETFLAWFEEKASIDPIIKAGIAHFYFVTIHPFDDGNGRMARTIADLALARADKMGQRFFSMSAQIRNERKTYYDILEETQKGTLDITAWLEWFLICLTRAIHGARTVLQDVLRKVRVWKFLNTVEVNERQHKMLNLLLDKDFFGALSTPKWAKMTGCSLDTANRDLAKLVEYGILEKSGLGKSTRYDLRSDL
jgi:Fic family protein